MLKFLKKLDIFETPVVFYSTSRNKKTNEKKFEQNHGSIPGGLFTLITRGCTLYYLYYLFSNMNKGTFDIITNKFSNVYIDQLYINN